MHTYEQVKAVKEKHESSLMKIQAVVGVGIGKLKSTIEYDSFCIRVYVRSAKDINAIPEVVDGVPIDVQVSGPIISH